MAQAFPISRADYINSDFKLVFDAIPNVLFKLQSVNMPGVTANPVTLPTPLAATYQWYGEKLTYEEFTATFIVDEELANYEEMYKWMLSLTNSQRPDQFHANSGEDSFPAALVAVDPTKNNQDFADATLFFLDANKQIKKKIVFSKVFPIALQSIDLEYSNIDPEVVLSTVTFTYDYFTII